MPRSRNVVTRWTRRLRSWRHHTPNDQVAWSLLGIGLVLVLVAGLVLGVDRGWL
ncbi:MAG TPA: hypothetical protein VGH30_09440 [Jatrophihabitantaceae bacterium]